MKSAVQCREINTQGTWMPPAAFLIKFTSLRQWKLSVCARVMCGIGVRCQRCIILCLSHFRTSTHRQGHGRVYPTKLWRQWSVRPAVCPGDASRHSQNERSCTVRRCYMFRWYYVPDRRACVLISSIHWNSALNVISTPLHCAECH